MSKEMKYKEWRRIHSIYECREVQEVIDKEGDARKVVLSPVIKKRSRKSGEAKYMLMEVIHGEDFLRLGDISIFNYKCKGTDFVPGKSYRIVFQEEEENRHERN